MKCRTTRKPTTLIRARSACRRRTTGGVRPGVKDRASSPALDWRLCLLDSVPRLYMAGVRAKSAKNTPPLSGGCGGGRGGGGRVGGRGGGARRRGAWRRRGHGVRHGHGEAGRALPGTSAARARRAGLRDGHGVRHGHGEAGAAGYKRGSGRGGGGTVSGTQRVARGRGAKPRIFAAPQRRTAQSSLFQPSGRHLG